MHRSSPRRLATVVVAVTALLAGACSDIVQLAEDLPELRQRDLRFRPVQSSFLYDSDGNLITTFHGEENRTVIPLKRIPRHVREAAIAIEDERFYEHEGIDMKAIGRALVANVQKGGIAEGGSTITQQYVKNMIIAPGEIPERSFQRKLEEAALSRQLEKRLTKDEILERYLNTVYFGEGAYGIQAASRTYFNKPARKLSVAQGALLAAVIRSPATYNPYRRRKVSKQRRNVVINKMEQLGYLGPHKAERARNAKIRLHRKKKKETYPAPYFVDYVKRLIKYDRRFRKLGKTARKREEVLFTGGLRIHTTVDLKMQAAAEDAVRRILPYSTDPHASLVAIDPNTGYVKAMVGGRNYFARRRRDRIAKLNLAIQGEPGLGRQGTGKNKVKKAPGTGRQAGSAFKPFALAAAIEKGVPLTKVFEGGSGGSMVFPGANNGGPWTVHNYEGSAYGPMSLLEATVKSVNVIYAQLILEIGEENVVDVAARMGINTRLHPVASAVLGANEVNPLDMTSAYATFASNGLYHPPVAITKIVGPGGKVVYEDKSETVQAISPAVAYLATTALQQVIQRGTGTAALAIGRPAAGKTGTAQEYRDAWFAGYTPDLAAAVWVGYPEGAIEMKTSCYSSRCRPTRLSVTGGSWPTQIWSAFMARALAGTPAKSFSPPSAVDIASVTIDSRTGCLAWDGTPSQYRVEATFPSGSQPTEACPQSGDSRPQQQDDGNVNVPGVVGSQRGAAEATLRNQGFSVKVVSEKEKGRGKKRPGRVWRQSPGGGSKAGKGSTVTIWVNP